LQYVTGEFGIVSSSLGTNREEILLPNEVEGHSPTVDCGSTLEGEFHPVYTIAGLPHSNKFYLDTTYQNGKLIPLRFAGIVGYVIQPDGPADPKRALGVGLALV
jgi:hypothetical protein